MDGGISTAVPGAAVPVTEAQWNIERGRAKRIGVLAAFFGVLFVPSIGYAALVLGEATAAGSARQPAILGWMLSLFMPLTVIMLRSSLKQQEKSDSIVAALARQSAQAAESARHAASLREQQVRDQEFEGRVSNALEMTAVESEVIEVVERAITSVLPEAPVEFLLADNSHAHLLRVVSVAPTGQPPGCGVSAPDQCPAARRARTLRFASSDHFDACPKLRGRQGPAVSATCVPVSVTGRAVGVLHTTGPVDTSLPSQQVRQLGVLANLAGSRIGLLRVMADAQIQAATDTLTGLLNRRSFEVRLAAARMGEPQVTLAMADLDHFKTLNDTHGHETGDRALSLFANVLRSSFRATDLVCRYGGEEFVIAFPGCDAATAASAVDGMRARLDAAITVAGVPSFSVSVGVIEAPSHESLTDALARADAALFAAKRAGRNQLIRHDEYGREPVAHHGGELALRGETSRESGLT